MKRVLRFGIILLLSIFILPNSVSALINPDLAPSMNNDYSTYDYVIDEYNVNIIVNENNTYDVTETITAYFNVNKHGIFRTIPLNNTITRLDGTTSKNKAKITNVSVDNKYKISKNFGEYKIQIGSANKTVIGAQTYVIKYTYDIGKDPLKNHDELYYNIIGTEWDTAIGNVSFSITMPKKFDSSKLGFSSGTTGNAYNDNIVYSVDGNKISGEYKGILNEGEGLTVRCELEDGYFVVKTSIFMYLLFIIPVLFLIISLFLSYKYGKDDEVIETIEFYPPEGLNSLEVGYLYKGHAANNDVTSLLIYLANKGYIKISEIEKKGLFSNYKDFKITKLKEYDGDNLNEKIFLQGLFAAKFNPKYFSKIDSINDGENDEVTCSDLYNRFYVTMRNIIYNISTKENKNKLFEKSASSKAKYICFMIAAVYLIISVPVLLDSFDLIITFVSLLFPTVGFSVMFLMIFAELEAVYINGKQSNSKIVTVIIGLIFGLGFGGIPFAFFLLPILLQNSLYLILYIVGIVCVMGMFISLKLLEKRTPYGNEMLGKLRGFKTFLETAEKEKLESMVMKNPTYFYDILPYTYVLGVSDKWIKKFEVISLQAPNWYDSPTDFNMNNFGLFMRDTMASASSALSSNPSDSSSGGSSGGGSSGGGSGGGGGGSW